MRTKFKVLFIIALLLSLAAAPSAHAVLQAVGPADLPSPPGNGFPFWYQDTTGLSLAPCFDTNGFCPTTMTSGPNFNATLPLAFPTNFPEEFFYYTAFAGAVGATDLLYEAAIEGAFANLVQPGDQMVFARIRMRANVDALGTYTVIHPYGTETFQVDAILPGPEINFTEDIGIAPGVFTGALAGKVGPFLRPTTGFVTAPDGNRYLSNPLTEVTVTGSPTGNNFVRFTGPAGLLGETTLFLLEGKIVGMTATPQSITFPTQKANITSATQTVTITNIDSVNTLTLGPITFAGTNAADFAVTADTCTTAPVAASGTCTFGVVFSSATTTPAARTGQAVVTPTAPAGLPPATIALAGTIDGIPPTVTQTFPTNGQTIPANSTVTAIFSEPMAPATINGTSIAVAGPGGAIAGNVTYDVANKTATFIPSTTFTSNQTVTVTISTAATDLAGNGLAADNVFAFVTIPPDVTRPTILTRSPLPSALGVRLNSTIQVTFDEQMHAASIDTTRFLVTTGGASVAGSITYDATTRTATFTPAANLAPGTAYSVTIKGGAGGVDDLAQNTLAADDAWTFFSNHHPSAAALQSPDDGSTGHATSITFKWAKSTDDDGDALEYHIEICQNAFFVGCDHQLVPPTASAPKLNGAYFAGVSGFGLAMIGLVSFGGIKGKKRLFMLLIALMLVSGTLISACSRDKTNTVAVPQPSSAEVSFTASNLNAGALYFWRVETHDPNGGAGQSETRSFRTQ